MKKGNNKMKTQEYKANLYMVMGLMLIIITTLWILSSIIPKVVFAIVAVTGLIPIIKMLTVEFQEVSDSEKVFWNKAMQGTSKWVLGLLIYFWVSACINKIMNLGLCTDVCYMIPILVGVAYIVNGHYFQLYKIMEEVKEDE